MKSRNYSRTRGGIIIKEKKAKYPFICLGILRLVEFSRALML